jgi:hypothetical protein
VPKHDDFAEAIMKLASRWPLRFLAARPVYHSLYTPENQMQFATAPSKLNLDLTNGDGGNGELLIAMLYLTDKSLLTCCS